MIRQVVVAWALLALGSGTAAADDPYVSPTALRTALEHQRAAHLARFHKYRKAGVYPHNTYEPGLLNVWRDGGGNLCAVATMVNADGRTELVESLATSDNNVRVSTTRPARPGVPSAASARGSRRPTSRSSTR